MFVCVKKITVNSFCVVKLQKIFVLKGKFCVQKFTIVSRIFSKNRLLECENEIKSTEYDGNRCNFL